MSHTCDNPQKLVGIAQARAIKVAPGLLSMLMRHQTWFLAFVCLGARDISWLLSTTTTRWWRPQGISIYMAIPGYSPSQARLYPLTSRPWASPQYNLGGTSPPHFKKKSFGPPHICHQNISA